jgi:hypothetical protein
VKKLNWLHIPYFWGKNHQIPFFFKTSKLFCHISFDLDSNLGHFIKQLFTIWTGFRNMSPFNAKSSWNAHN